MSKREFSLIDPLRKLCKICNFDIVELHLLLDSLAEVSIERRTEKLGGGAKSIFVNEERFALLTNKESDSLRA